MKLLSVNVGLPRLISFGGDTFKTGIFKYSIDGRVALRTTNLDGDRQADLSVHGGPNKAVYLYPSEHYPEWNREIPGLAGSWGAFGENFTTEGLLENAVSIGDRYRLGSATLVVTTPRLPCFKLAAKFKREDIIGRFVVTGRCGFYFSVEQEGEVGAGDEFELLGRDDLTLTVAEVNSLYIGRSPDRATLEKSLLVTKLPLSWRMRFSERLADIGLADNDRQDDSRHDHGTSRV